MGGQVDPHARDLGHTSSWARSSEVGFAPGSPTYIAHVDGSLVDLHLLLSHVCEETCRDKGLSQDGVAGALDQRHICPPSMAITKLTYCKAPRVPGHVWAYPNPHTAASSLAPSLFTKETHRVTALLGLLVLNSVT